MISAGIILGAGNYAALLTIQSLGVAQGYPLTQLGIIINTLWGVLYFKEVTSQKTIILITISIFLALVGIFVLNKAHL